VGEKSLSVGFTTSDGVVAHDLRSPADSGWVWDFRVATSDQNADVKMDFEGLANVKEGYLLDKDSRMVYPLDELKQVKASIANGLRHYRIIVGSKEFVSELSESVQSIHNHALYVTCELGCEDHSL
jgi:hypothetical protein